MSDPGLPERDLPGRDGGPAAASPHTIAAAAGPDGMLPGDAERLWALRYHWGARYEIARTPQAWRARPRDGGEMLTAQTAADLREQIAADHAARS